MLNRTALTVFLYASFLYFLKRIVFVKRHVWFFRIYSATDISVLSLFLGWQETIITSSNSKVKFVFIVFFI